MEDPVSHWSEEPEGGYTVTPALTFFSCSLCSRPFRIAASHREAVEAHHRRKCHPGDMRAVLNEED